MVDPGMTTNTDCIFCKIVAGEIPANVVLDTPGALAFLDVAPLAPGHTLLVPRSHHKQISDLSPDAMAEVTRHLPELARAVTTAVGAEGTNVLQNNGSVAGQVVNHVHFHIIPRFDKDGLGFRWSAGTYATGEADALIAKIKEQLA